MSHRSGRDAEPNTAYVNPILIDFYKPQSLYYTTRSELECRRFFCSVCGEMHPANVHHGQRVMEWITGTTLPDALSNASEAKKIDDMVQARYQRGSSLPGYLEERKQQSLPSKPKGEK